MPLPCCPAHPMPCPYRNRRHFGPLFQFRMGNPPGSARSCTAKPVREISDELEEFLLKFPGARRLRCNVSALIEDCGDYSLCQVKENLSPPDESEEDWALIMPSE